MWIATGHTDMRRGMNSLALLVQEAFRRDPHGGDLYVFRGKSGKLICATTVRLPAQICRRPCSSTRPIVAVRIRSSIWPAMPG
ncbi:IS66 family insertion sequence element accessory protein TnpB [Bradyrhizobium erythrophlei]|uniref:IS66 family insertion sequence element accessory protein TnpB n=1 Tax=Bradyrhizobium erythrophlei TaxID=1437360 RepID=UPI0030B80895